MKKLRWVSWHRQAERANYVDCKEYRTTFETAVVRTRKSATADDDILRSLVFQYEDALKEGKGQGDALGRVERYAMKAVEKELWPKENLDILRLAIEAGKMARQAGNPVLGGLTKQEERRLACGISAAQELVKANPVVLRLPFIQEVMMYILLEQKYGDKPLDMREGWRGFLASRHRLVKLTGSPESYRRLIKKAKAEGVKVNTGDAVAEGLTAVAHIFGVSESKLKKYTADKARGRGRAKKK